MIRRMETQTEKPDSPGLRLSLVLGSGGARGLAHIGVIDALLERNFRIESIVGTSMGALIGGVYAMGKLDVYRDWVCALDRIDVFRLLDISFGPTGVFRGEKIIGVLRESIGDKSIEDLPIKFTAVATDLDARKEVWIDRGLLFDAIRASMAVPTVFTPYRRNGRTLVDGGLLNPVPVTPTVRDDTDLTIAVDLGGPEDPRVGQWMQARQPRQSGELDSYRNRIHKFVDGILERIAGSFEQGDEADQLGLLEIVQRSFEVMQGTVARHKLASHPPDLLITVPHNICKSFDFYKAAALIELGQELTRRSLESLPGKWHST